MRRTRHGTPPRRRLQRESAVPAVLRLVAAGGGRFLVPFVAESPFARHLHRRANQASLVACVVLLSCSTSLEGGEARMSRHSALADLEGRLRVPAAPGSFLDGELTGLPDPVMRYFHAAIAPGAPLARAATLAMQGRLKLNGRWMPLRARQVLAPHQGLVWRARVAGVITGSDRLAEGHGVMDWKLLGLFPVAHDEGEDIARSAAGRGAGEAMWLPTALLPRFGVRWDATGDNDLTAFLSGNGVDTTLHLHTDRHGHPEWVRFDRWGDPDQTGTWGLHPFGFQVTGTRTFGPLTIPSSGSAGWFHGTDRWLDGEFIRCDITALDPVPAP